MKRLASRAIAGDLGVNSRASTLGVIVILEHEHPGAFGQHKAVAVGRKWTRSPLRLVIPRLCQRANHGVALNDSFRNWRIHPACHKHRLHAGLNELIGVAENVSRVPITGMYQVGVAAVADSLAD